MIQTFELPADTELLLIEDDEMPENVITTFFKGEFFGNIEVHETDSPPELLN